MYQFCTRHTFNGLYFLLNKFSNDLHCHKSHQDSYRTILGFISTGQYYRDQALLMRCALLQKMHRKILTLYLLITREFILIKLIRLHEASN